MVTEIVTEAPCGQNHAVPYVKISSGPFPTEFITLQMISWRMSQCNTSVDDKPFSILNQSFLESSGRKM